VDPSTLRQVQSVGAPRKEAIAEQGQNEQRRELEMARDAAALQQNILRELESMNEEERTATLETAKQVNNDFLQRAMEIPPGPDRIAFMRSIDWETQRKLLMHKLWTSMLAANGGKPPNSQEERDSI
jgi:hypothetical protein